VEGNIKTLRHNDLTVEDICKHIYALDAAYSLVPPLQDDIIVYRGSDRNDANRKKVVDGKWTHKSYLSTTTRIISRQHPGFFKPINLHVNLVSFSVSESC